MSLHPVTAEEGPLAREDLAAKIASRMSLSAMLAAPKALA
jgi:hypothetical protein